MASTEKPVLSKEQQEQEDEYFFPYHHVPKIDANGFTQSFMWAWGLPYLGGIRFITDKLDEMVFDSLIDIGCGDGRLLKELHARFPQKRLVGVDYSERAISFARAFCPDVDYRSLDLLSFQFEESFDVASMIEVYEHIPYDICNKFLSAVTNLLNENGILILTVPHENTPVPKKHYRHFNSKSLAAELEQHFEKVLIIPFDRRPLFLRLLDKICNRQDFLVGRQWLNNLRWRYYIDYCLTNVKEDECKRIAAVCTKKRSPQ